VSTENGSLLAGYADSTSTGRGCGSQDGFDAFKRVSWFESGDCVSSTVNSCVLQGEFNVYVPFQQIFNIRVLHLRRCELLALTT
jgi:hypothetical protein